MAVAWKQQYSLRKDCDRVQWKHRVNAYNDQILGKCLGNNQTVKRIFVMRQEMLECQYMRQLYWKQFNPVDELLAGNNLGQGTIKIKLSKLPFDLHLPDTCHTQDEGVCLILA